jgi:hypothetical protein
MRAATSAWIQRSDDQGRHAEPPEIVAGWEAQMKRTYDERLERIRQQAR